MSKRNGVLLVLGSLYWRKKLRTKCVIRVEILITEIIHSWDVVVGALKGNSCTGLQAIFETERVNLWYIYLYFATDEY